jgi:rubrerythrin
MPYRMVIPQERDHIEAIRKLFAAYGTPADASPGPVAETKSLAEAYEKSIELERDLSARYERLIENSPDGDSAAILKKLLFQTQHHQMMFENALRMGGRMGPGMMRGPGPGI